MLFFTKFWVTICAKATEIIKNAQNRWRQNIKSTQKEFLEADFFGN
jgi:hypothetical protein